MSPSAMERNPPAAEEPAQISAPIYRIAVLVWLFLVGVPHLAAVMGTAQIWLLVRSIVVLVMLLRVLGCCLLAVVASVLIYNLIPIIVDRVPRVAAQLLEVEVVSRVVVPVALRVNRTALSRIYAVPPDSTVLPAALCRAAVGRLIPVHRYLIISVIRFAARCHAVSYLATSSAWDSRYEGVAFDKGNEK
ncbi:hypothetical protein N7522_003165 [Penicillium canescens]|nr:hypothetical protein N7522_003165 [Penicillium canescens]